MFIFRLDWTRTSHLDLMDRWLSFRQMQRSNEGIQEEYDGFFEFDDVGELKEHVGFKIEINK